MKPDAISLRRRHLMIAGVAGAVAPGVLFAKCGPRLEGALTNAVMSGRDAVSGELVVSGRILHRGCAPIPGAEFEVLMPGSVTRPSTSTDADGRFMLTFTLPRETRIVRYRVIHPQHSTSAGYFHVTRAGSSAPQRDEIGVWRMTVGLSLA